MQNRPAEIKKYPYVIKVIPKDNYILEAYFGNGVVKAFDCNYLFEDDFYKPLKRTYLFNKAYANLGGVVWNDEIDIAAEEVYDKGVTVDNDN